MDLAVHGELARDDQTADNEAGKGRDPGGEGALVLCQGVPDQYAFQEQVANQLFQMDEEQVDRLRAEALQEDLRQAEIEERTEQAARLSAVDKGKDKSDEGHDSFEEKDRENAFGIVFAVDDADGNREGKRIIQQRARARGEEEILRETARGRR